ncbi:TolC family protein [Flaviaesturariibacter amylovorans]|uniref:TolC family protein n=1 Tax=Flaviaesturariibacter amylovorans TaxID=1084520 RepID=A0ABP8GJZ0_9BACT
MTLHRVFLLIVFVLAARLAGAQTLTLQQCIDTALARNLDVARTALGAESAEVQLQQARGARLPNLTGDLYHAFNQGRGIDPTSNGYVNQSLNFANYQLNSGVVLFNGGALRQTQLQRAAAWEAARLEVQQAKDFLAINVITAYLQLLINEDLLQAVTRQAELSRQQYERLELMHRQGAIRPSELSDMKGQWMADQLAISNARNALETARLVLAQLLNKPYHTGLTVARIDTSAFREPYGATVAQVLEEASGQFPSLKAAGLRTESARHGILSARGSRAPVLSVGGGLATAYSSAARDGSGKLSYNSQLRNNFSTTVGVGLTVPLFNRLQGRSRVRLAEIEWKATRVQEALVTQQLRQQVEAAWLNLTNAGDRLGLLETQADAYAESYAAAEVRYKAGVGTSVDYLIAKDRMDRARIGLIMARYDFVLRKQVLDYFRGAGRR